jgi:hypothetical protein
MSSTVRESLAAYVAGDVKAERLVIAVSAAYYRETLKDSLTVAGNPKGLANGRGRRETLRPLIDVIDRASPGIVELGVVPGGAGFEIRLAERPFPKAYEAELRRAAEAVLAGMGAVGSASDVGAQHAAPLPTPTAHPRDPSPRGGFIARVLSAVRRLFTASA